MLECQPVFLIGAARSGTRLLRDVIAQHPNVDMVPFDINYVWRLGNEKLEHDEIPADAITPMIQERIIRNIGRFGRGAPLLIEKTVSNCLRIPFVAKVFPQARFLNLTRHGEDVVESAYRQWTARPRLSYIYAKGRRFPLSEAPSYAARYLLKVMRRSFKRRPSTFPIWGPAYAGIREDLAELSLWQVCAIQWAKSIENAFEGFSYIGKDKVLSVRYEEFVRDPANHLLQIASFLALDAQVYQDPQILNSISIQNIGKANGNIPDEERAMIRPYLERAMKLCGYSFY